MLPSLLNASASSFGNSTSLAYFSSAPQATIAIAAITINIILAFILSFPSPLTIFRARSVIRLMERPDEFGV